MKKPCRTRLFYTLQYLLLLLALLFEVCFWYSAAWVMHLPARVQLAINRLMQAADPIVHSGFGILFYLLLPLVFLLLYLIFRDAATMRKAYILLLCGMPLWILLTLFGVLSGGAVFGELWMALFVFSGVNWLQTAGILLYSVILTYHIIGKTDRRTIG